MLRVSHGHVTSSGSGPSIAIRSRGVVPTPVFEPPPDETIVVRGRMRKGGAAALILEPSAVCIVSADRASRCRLRRFTIAEVLGVEEHRGARSTELVIVTATTSVSMMEVDIAQAWTFCRELRQLILQSSLDRKKN